MEKRRTREEEEAAEEEEEEEEEEGDLGRITRRQYRTKESSLLSP